MYVLHCVGLVTNDLVIYYIAVDKTKDFKRIQIHFIFPAEKLVLFPLPPQKYFIEFKNHNKYKKHIINSTIMGNH